MFLYILNGTTPQSHRPRTQLANFSPSWQPSRTLTIWVTPSVGKTAPSPLLSPVPGKSITCWFRHREQPPLGASVVQADFGASG